MRFGHFSLLGLIGVLVCMAGAHLVWNDRRLATAWLRELSRLLRGQVAGAQAAALRQRSGAAQRRGATLTLASAMALIVIGQFLFLFDLIR